MYFTPSEKTYAWSGAGPALLHTAAFGPDAGQTQVSPVGTTIAGVTLTTLGHAPPGSDFQNVAGGPHQTLAPAACGDCRDPPTPRLTTTAGLSEMTSCSSWSMYNSVLTAVSRAAMPLDEVSETVVSPEPCAAASVVEDTVVCPQAQHARSSPRIGSFENDVIVFAFPFLPKIRTARGPRPRSNEQKEHGPVARTAPRGRQGVNRALSRAAISVLLFARLRRLRCRRNGIGGYRHNRQQSRVDGGGCARDIGALKGEGI